MRGFDDFFFFSVCLCVNTHGDGQQWHLFPPSPKGKKVFFFFFFFRCCFYLCMAFIPVLRASLKKSSSFRSLFLFIIFFFFFFFLFEWVVPTFTCVDLSSRLSSCTPRMPFGVLSNKKKKKKLFFFSSFFGGFVCVCVK